jgi:bacterioferritin-associated ferredoxin
MISIYTDVAFEPDLQPSAMYVCLCRCVRDRDLRQAAEAGVRSFEELKQATGVSTGCGRCEEMAREVFDRALDPGPLCVQPA